MTAYVGRATGYSFAVAKGSDNTKTLAQVSALPFSYIGAARGKENDSSWTTADATHSDSPDFKKQSLVTFNESTIKVDGVFIDDGSANLVNLENAINYPDKTTQGGEPYMFIKEVHPVTGTRYFFCMGTKFTVTSSYDDTVKWSAEWTVLNRISA